MVTNMTTKTQIRLLHIHLIMEGGSPILSSNQFKGPDIVSGTIRLDFNLNSYQIPLLRFDNLKTHLGSLITICKPPVEVCIYHFDAVRALSKVIDLKLLRQTGYDFGALREICKQRDGIREREDLLERPGLCRW